MEDWRGLQKRQLEAQLKDTRGRRRAVRIKSALTNLAYIEHELLPKVSSDAQFRLAQQALLNVQVQLIRLQLESMQVE